MRHNNWFQRNWWMLIVVLIWAMAVLMLIDSADCSIEHPC